MSATPVFLLPTIRYLTVLFTVLLNPHQPKPQESNLLAFDASYWCLVSPSRHAKRYTNRQRMLADLRQQVLPGKSLNEIEAILGADERRFFTHVGDRYKIKTASEIIDERDYELKADLVYFLGKTTKSRFGPETHEWLCIYVDMSGMYERSEIIEEPF